MAGNSQRKGAMRNAGSKKGATVGSGGQRRKQLKGKGPTPKASERTGHPAARRARAAEKAATRTTSRGGKRADGREVLVGRNPVVEALRAEIPASALYVQQYIDTDERVREALTLAADRGLPLMEVGRPELDRMSGGAVHQGLLLTVPAYKYLDPDDLLADAIESNSAPLIVALDGVTDPRNLGAIVRSAAAFGAHGVLIPERRAAGVTGSAWKASAGALATVPVARATNLARSLTAYRKAGLSVVGLAAQGDLALPDLTAELATEPLVIVVGGEGGGLGRLVSETCDHLVSIPMTAAAESLNASVAAGITLYAVAAGRASSRR